MLNPRAPACHHCLCPDMQTLSSLSASAQKANSHQVDCTGHMGSDQGGSAYPNLVSEGDTSYKYSDHTRTLQHKDFGVGLLAALITILFLLSMLSVNELRA